MKYLLIVLLFTGCASSTPLKGLVTAQVADTMKVADNVKIMDSLNAKVAESMKVAETLEAKMVDMQNANVRLIDSLKLQLEATVKAQAGVNNKIEEVNAGRDVIKDSGNTNDTGLMKTIFKYWYGIFVLIIGLTKWVSISQIKEKDEEIERLEADKKFYKEKYISEVCKDQADLEKLRADKEKYLQEKIDKKEVKNV